MHKAPIAAAVVLLALTAATTPSSPRRAAKAKPSAAARAPASPFARGVGQPQVTAACAACHPPTIITTKRYSDDKWTQVVEQMITRGAKVSDADFDVVVAYLTQNYGVARR